jgi:hypothetical protein
LTISCASNRIRRISALEVLDTVRAQPVHVAAGTSEAACAHIQILLPRLQLVHAQLKASHKRIENLLDRVAPAREDVTDEGPKMGAS